MPLFSVSLSEDVDVIVLFTVIVLLVIANVEYSDTLAVKYTR